MKKSQSVENQNVEQIITVVPLGKKYSRQFIMIVLGFNRHTMWRRAKYQNWTDLELAVLQKHE